MNRDHEDYRPLFFMIVLVYVILWAIGKTIAG